MNVVYAFCRITDDIVDQAADHGEDPVLVSKELLAWRDSTHKVLNGQGREDSHPILRELSGVASQYKIPEEYFMGLIEGCRMDLEKKAYATFHELYGYCYRVASMVGLMCLRVFGAHDPKSKDFAADLGLAFQLTNILRDIRSDMERGRVYIPEEDLAKFGFSREGFLALPRPAQLSSEQREKFLGLMNFELARAQDYYFKARANLKSPDRGALVAAEVMSSVYHAVLEKIQNNPLQVLDRKVQLPKMIILMKVLQGWLGNLLRLS